LAGIADGLVAKIEDRGWIARENEHGGLGVIGKKALAKPDLAGPCNATPT
jgi:hypothetical protein